MQISLRFDNSYPVLRSRFLLTDSRRTLIALGLTSTTLFSYLFIDSKPALTT